MSDHMTRAAVCGKLDSLIALEETGLNALADIASSIRDQKFEGGREISLAITKLEESLHRLRDARIILEQK